MNGSERGNLTPVPLRGNLTPVPLRGNLTPVPLRGNPFIGPRPFVPGEKLYGRDREIAELIDRLHSERIILLHSPSGAGKSSLMQAGLLPELKGSFDIWGPTRVNQEPTPGAVNRYVASANLGFEEAVPERLRRPSETLVEQTLPEYFAGRPRRKRAPRNVLLIFDQFEEVLTVDPLAVAAKRDFFDQLGQLLHSPRIWALFAMREDYLAQLEGGGLELVEDKGGRQATLPLARRVPTHFKNRFRIDLLGLGSAREAMVEPARTGGRDFPAVDRLVRDLATMKVQQPDGHVRPQTGLYVEPVQLQVVCRRLWDAMPADDLSIDAQDLDRFGKVDQALGAYYDESVSDVAGRRDGVERDVREWFDQLITGGGIRGQVPMEAEASGGLANDLIDRLRNTHLVRAEKRAGATWFELAHDRLIEPVRTRNDRWFEDHLGEVQKRAALWDREGRPAGLLMRGEELAEGEHWAAGNQTGLTDMEQRFLADCREAQDATLKEEQQARRIRKWAKAAMVAGALALLASVVAGLKWREAEQRRTEAEDQRTEAEDQRKKIAELILEANRQSGRAQDLEQILEGPLEELVTVRARAEPLERNGQPITQRIGGAKMRLWAITLWIDVPDIRKAEIEAVDYKFPNPTYRPQSKTGEESDSGFAITYTGWGCLDNVELWIRTTAKEPPLRTNVFDQCEALGWSEGIPGTTFE